ncbi:hypothetical protein RIF29_25895 [Crotalaria pallida]|uniref:Uncharacterized protein n=1 Tax=Crotalaria pallida TaxID=3830 RepID=A0AAN9EN13_CROPI
MNKKDASSENPGGEENNGASQPRLGMEMEIPEEAGGKATNQEDNPNYDKKDLENHFGPWMLVRRPNRRKEFARNNNGSNTATAPLTNGNIRKSSLAVTRSRFAALEKEAEERILEENVNTEARAKFTDEENVDEGRVDPKEAVDIVKQKVDIFKKHFSIEEPPDRGPIEDEAIHEEERASMETDASDATEKAPGKAVDCRVGSGSMTNNL